MRTPILSSILVAAALVVLDGCSQEPPRAGAPVAAPAEEKPAPQAPPPPVVASTTPAVKTPAATTPAVKTPAVKTPAATTPAVKTPAVKAPVVKKPAADPVREKVGAGKCRACHRLQYDSWVKSGHARKALDCEGCHGNGSDYAKAAVMKDRARAKAAGLIFQTASFCEKCHPTADATFLPRAHAHKPK